MRLKAVSFGLAPASLRRCANDVQGLCQRGCHEEEGEASRHGFQDQISQHHLGGVCVWKAGARYKPRCEVNEGFVLYQILDEADKPFKIGPESL